MPVPSRAFLIAMGRADGTIHVQHDVFEPVAIMEAVNPLAIKVGQCLPVLGRGQRLDLKPSHLRGRGRLRLDSPTTHHLAHDRIKGETVSIIDVFVARQTSINRLSIKSVKPVNDVLAPAGVIERTGRKIRQPEHFIQLAHHQQTAVGTELRAAKFQPHPTVKTKPPIARFARTLWVIHNPPPSAQLTC